jgi:DNA polymerase-3 subunit delta
MMKTLEDLAVYCQKPLESTVLVIAMHGAGADKRKSLYKSVSKIGVVVDSQALRDYEMPKWISMFYQTRGLRIAPDAAALLAEHAGTDLNKIAIETDKMLKNLPEGTVEVSAADIEKNVGISRQFSIFELTKELSFKNSAKALKIATMMGNAAKFSLAMTVSALYTHYSRILKYAALVSKGGSISPEDKARALAGVNPYFYREYDTAVRNYPLPKAMMAMSLLCQYDYLSKGGDGAGTSDSSLLKELVVKLLNL